jgi:hypothetical protein
VPGPSFYRIGARSRDHPPRTEVAQGWSFPSFHWLRFTVLSRGLRQPFSFATVSATSKADEKCPRKHPTFATTYIIPILFSWWSHHLYATAHPDGFLSFGFLAPPVIAECHNEGRTLLACRCSMGNKHLFLWGSSVRSSSRSRICNLPRVLQRHFWPQYLEEVRIAKQIH